MLVWMMSSLCHKQSPAIFVCTRTSVLWLRGSLWADIDLDRTYPEDRDSPLDYSFSWDSLTTNSKYLVLCPYFILCHKYSIYANTKYTNIWFLKESKNHQVWIVTGAHPYRRTRKSVLAEYCGMRMHWLPSGMTPVIVFTPSIATYVTNFPISMYLESSSDKVYCTNNFWFSAWLHSTL